MIEADAEQQKAATRLFAGACDFVWGAATLDQLPKATLPEVAFVGRSNVGKSSLVNAITGRNSLARTSHTPGRTQQLNFFNLGDRLMLVDLPGYGYAKVSKTQVDAWTRLLRTYLAGRQQLRRVCLLVDGRHGIKDSDLVMMDMLDAAAVTYQVILTKKDKMTKAQAVELPAAIETVLKKRPAAHPFVFVTSAHDKDGISILQSELYAFALEKK